MKRGLLPIVCAAAAASIASCGRYAENGPDVDAQPESDSASSSSTTATTGTTSDCGDGATGAPGHCSEPLACDLPSIACGGNVVGTWNVEDCPLELTGPVDVSRLGIGCIYGTTLSGSLQISGTWIADGVGNVDDDTTTKGAHEFELPRACLDIPEIADCSVLGTPLQNAFGYATIECRDDRDTGGCICTGTFDQRGGMGAISSLPVLTGRYTVDGSTLTTVDRGVETTFGHCVMDDAMVLTPTTANQVGMIEGSIVLQRQ